MAVGCGLKPTSRKARRFNSACRALRTVFESSLRCEGLAKALCQAHFVNGLAKITDDTIPLRASSVGVIGVGRHENCWNGAASVDETFMELQPAHYGHLDVCNQTDRVGDKRGCQEIGRGSEDLDRIAQRPQKSPHGFTEELIVFDDGDQ
jgi:hypothetical protein